MTLSESIQTVLVKNYCNFNGRASRSEYWWWFLFQFLIGWGIAILGLIGGHGDSEFGWAMILDYIVALAFLLPNLGLAVRRMHDIGKGGGWIFITLVPLIGAIWFIVLCATPGEPGENRFGDAPLS